MLIRLDEGTVFEQMLVIPGPGVLEHFVRARQEQLQPSRHVRTAVHTPARVRIGHALIAAGSALSGERAERPARPSSSPRPA